MIRNALAALALACAVLLSPVPNAARAAAPRPLESADFDRMLDVASPACSPDGAWIAYTVEGADALADERRSVAWMVNWEGTRSVRLTSASGWARKPRFSPDGRYISFLSARAPDEHEQIFLLERTGGEAQAITSVNGEIDDYDWSPDGQRIVISMSPGEGGAGAGEHGAAPVARPIVIDRLHFKQDKDGYLGVGERKQLYLLDVASHGVVPLTADARFDDTDPAWSPDGRTIAFFSGRETDPDRSGRIELYLIEAHPGASPQRLARLFAPTDRALSWSGDGARIVYAAGAEPRLNAYMQGHLEMVSLSGAAPQVLAAQLDRALTAPVRLADDKAIGALLEDDGARLPARLHLDSGRIERRLEARLVASEHCAAGGHVALVASTDGAPPEIYALEGTRLRKLSGHNDALMSELALGAVEDIAFASRDGTDIHGMLVKPPGFHGGRPYPTLLWIHGGPNLQDAHGLSFSTYSPELERQWFAAHGYVVLGVNYRGSAGRGQRFSASIAADWGDKEVADLLAAIDWAVRARIADPGRLGIGGWSYGGILTDYVLATDARFKAGVSGAGSANQISMWGADEYITQYNAELGAPWQSPALWVALSYPFFHADRIKTPTLFVAAEKDFDVPVAGAEQMYAALRTLGVPTQLVVYPGQYHELTRPSFIRDRLQRYLAWYQRYLGPPAP